MNGNRRAAVASIASILAIGAATPVLAQDATSAQPDVSETRDDAPTAEILVTARKRQESILQVPVVVAALDSQRLERLQVTQINDLPKLVPGLVVGNNLLSVGTQIALRGVGTSSSDPGVDQSVSLNLDGLALGQGLAFQSGLFDLQQIEVLKGPQALFYGKSSPGGVISLRTADPTDQVEVTARAGYELDGNEGRGELILSGPVSDTLKARLATMYSKGEGYFRNTALAVPGTGAVNPYKRETRPESFMARGTILWNPSDRFSARLKVNYVYDHSVNAEAWQLGNCPEGPGQSLGIPFIGGDDCKLDRNLGTVYMDPANFPGIPNNGVPYLKNRQIYGTLELNYDLSSSLSLTSTTGYYNLRSRSLVNTSHTTAAGVAFAFWNRFSRREFTQEFRLNSDFSGPLNFTLGGFFQDGLVKDQVLSTPNTAYPAFLAFIRPGNGQTDVDIRTYSAFGQARWKILPDLELAAGARYTDETRKESVFNYITASPIPVAVPKLHASNVAPEATLTYTPTQDLTFFAAYKQAYKSGSFSIATVPTPGSNNSFGDEKVEGGEIGMKSRLLDRQLLFNIAAYDYRYYGLQVGAVEPTVGGAPIIRTVNAGSARTYGVDLDFSFRPRSIEGLAVNASVNWNRGRYKVLDTVPCYSGQTVALGCTGVFAPSPATAAPGRPSQASPGPGSVLVNGQYGYYTAQDLSGTPMIRAPEWQATFGFDYELPLGSKGSIVFSNSNQYSGRFVRYLAAQRPNDDQYQGAFIKSDVSVAFRGPEERWELALIGKNITDKITASNCSATNFAGGLVLGDQAGGTVPGASGLGELGCYTDRGRSVWLRFTWKPFGGR